MNDLSALAAAIAAELGAPWKLSPVHPDDDGRVLVHPDRYRLILSLLDPPPRRHRPAPTGPRPGPRRLEIRGQLPSSPYGTPHGVHGPSITVAVRRGAPVIAREIGNRLMPVYRDQVAKALAHHDQRQRDTEAREALADQIRSVLPGAHTGWTRSPKTSTNVNWSTGSEDPVYAFLSLSGDASAVRLEIGNVPAEVALEVCRLLATRAVPALAAAS